MIPYLSILWLSTIAAAFLVLALGQGGAAAARRGTLVASAAMLVYALALWIPYSADEGLFRLSEEYSAHWFGIHYALGVDGVALLLVWLNAFLTVVAVATSRSEKYGAGFFACLLFLQGAVNGVFLTRDLFFFYFFWEAELIPMFFLIGIWGSENRRHAAVKFLLYTVGGSLFMLLGFLALVTIHHQTTGIWSWAMEDMAALNAGALAPWIYLGIALGFAVKVPLFPFHNWLPDAHTEAPAAGSIILAGVLLKMGVYGFLRILLPVFPEMSRSLLPWLGALAAFNVVYGAVCAFAQTDLKRLVAYTSISHLGYCMLGLYSFTAQGVAGGSLQMINHGLSTGALFLMIGILYERSHRRGVSDFGDLATRAPKLAFLFGLVAFSSIGLPGLNGFIGEAMSLAGMASMRPDIAAVALLGGILAAAYLLPAYGKVFWAPAGPGSVSAKVDDIDGTESAVLWTFAALIVWIGLYPAPLLKVLEPTVSALVK